MRGAMEEAQQRSDLATLRGLGLDLGSASGVNEAVNAAGKRLRAAVGVDSVVTVVRPDAAARLRVVWREGQGSPTRPDPSAQRRAVFRSNHALRAPLTGPGERALGMIPLLSHGNAIGILEIEASDRSLEARWEVLEIIGSQLATVLASLSEQALRNERLDTALAWTAHELRGPILGVRSVLELLLERAGADPRDPLIIRRSIDELDRLVGTAEAVLGWAVGTRSLQRRRTDVVRVVEEAVESCRLETGQDGIVVSFDRRAVARIDPAHIRAAIANLLRNALAFAEPGTKVEASVDRSGDMVMVSVKDFGPEIPAIERELIFSPFVRGTAPGRATNGSGLGLFIARRVVEAHGGRIWVESDRESVTFRVLLPVMGTQAPGIAS
jgi:signal transduction histidine kinase